MGKKAFLVANDFGESACIEKIDAELKNQGYETVKVLGKGKNLTLTYEMVKQASEAGILITAISEFHETEVKLAVAVRKARPDMPIVVYAPGWYAFRIKGAIALRGIADLLLVSNQREVSEAETLYPRAKKVAAVGNLLHEEFYPSCSVAEARQKAVVENDRALIFIPGDKGPRINLPLFESVVAAAHRERIQKHKPVVAIGIHPGDNTYLPDMYQNLSDKDVPVKIFTRDILPSATLVLACDLLVTALSTLAVAAAFQRKPVIGFYCENLLADTEAVQGSRVINWELENNGAALVVHKESVDLLEKTMAVLLQTNSLPAKQMKINQMQNYPEPPVPGSTAKKAVELIKLLG